MPEGGNVLGRAPCIVAMEGNCVACTSAHHLGRSYRLSMLCIHLKKKKTCLDTDAE